MTDVLIYGGGLVSGVFWCLTVQDWHRKWKARR